MDDLRSARPDDPHAIKLLFVTPEKIARSDGLMRLLQVRTTHASIWPCV